ncbi:MAG: hypothetical protein AAF563_06925 [Pseudomonadota bacterium]
MPPDQVRPAARMLCMQSHGIWLRCALDTDGITRDEACAQLLGLLNLLLNEEQLITPMSAADYVGFQILRSPGAATMAP